MTEELNDNEQIEKIGRENYQAVLNILTESPFFYADDDPVRFNSLRRHKSAFEKFFKKFFGWRLYVDAKMARLIRDKSFNPAVKASQQRYFNLSSRLECILFLILLEFYEHESDEQSFNYEDSHNLRFTFGNYFDFTRNTLSRQLGDMAPIDRDLDQEARSLLRKLEHYRLLRVVETDENNKAANGPELLIEALPGLNCYEGAKMAETVIQNSFGIDKSEFDDPSEATNSEETPDD